ncbi:MAG: c-type cytochrome [Ferruginibacter sp.]
MKNFKKYAIVITVIVFIVSAFAAIEPGNKPPRFKNLKVLPQDITPQALDSVMDHFKEALGVKCGYCHERNDSTKHMDFASDAKPEKDIARHMMIMASGINEKYFNFNNEKIAPQTITCYTCHRGSPMPMSMDTSAVRKR